MELIRLRVRSTADDAWVIALGRGDEPPAQGVVAAVTVDALRRAAIALEEPGDDDARAEAERGFGRALAAALASSGAPGRAWLRTTGQVEEQGRSAIVALDADPVAAALPWELLAVAPDAACLEPAGSGAVVRLAAAGAPLRDPDDRAARCVVRHLGAVEGPDPVVDAATAAAEARNLPWPLSGSTEERRVVTLVVHAAGRPALDALPDGDPELAHLVGGAELAWLAITGGPPGVDDRLAARLVGRRCAAVVTADRALSRAAAGAFSAGLHGALLSGESLLAAVIAGRAVLREHALAADDGRWWRLRLTTGHLRVLARAPFSTRLQAGPWRRPAEATAAVLRRAQVCGEVDGFVGVEHLAEATLDAGPREVATLLPLLRRLLPTWRDRLAHLEPQRHEDVRTRLTPRLLRVAGTLRPGFGLVELWGALIAEPLAWGRFLGAEPPETVGPAATLEVLGGPEDGRRLALRPGEVLGRASGSRQCDVALYDGLGWTDPRLSRRHLRWLDVGWAQPLAPVRAVHRADGPVPPPEGPFELAAGDLVEVSASTWLVAVPHEGSAT